MTDCTCGGDGVRYTLGAQHDCPIHGFPKRTSPHPSPGKALTEGARLSEVLAEHVMSGEPAVLANGKAWIWRCVCGTEQAAAVRSAALENHRAHVAAELESVVAARVAEAKASALREAADELTWEIAGISTISEARGWLRDRADRLAPDTSPGETDQCCPHVCEPEYHDE